MISSLSPTSQQMVNSMNTTQQNLYKLQAQVSSGYRISRASDDPGAISDLLATRSDLARITQVDKNLTSVQSEVQTADSAVQSAVLLLQNAGVLASQGASTTLTAAQRTTLADQVNGLLDQLVTISNTQVAGKYIFSGDSTSTAPYALDSSSTSQTGVTQNVTSPATRMIQDTSGLTFAASKTAQDLFGPTDSNGNPTAGNAFAALQSLKNALLGNDTAAITSAAGAVTAAHDYVNQQAGFYGDVENRITTALDLAKKFETQDQTSLSNMQDTDVASAALQMTQDTTHLNASLASAAKQPTSSLFDYLPPG